MKTTTHKIFLAALILPAIAQAQSTSFRDPGPSALCTSAARLPVPAVPKLRTAKTTASSPVTSLAHYIYDVVLGEARLNDSGIIAWSAPRTSVQQTGEFGVSVDIADYDQYETLNNYPGGLQPSYKSRNTYNTAGKLINNVYENWQTASSTWGNYTRTAYTYSGSSETELVEMWHKGTSTWRNLSRRTINTSAGTREEIYEEWDGSAWMNKYKYLSHYSGTSITEFVFMMWDAAGGAWKNASRGTYTYSGTDLTESVSAQWIDASGTWVNVIRTLYTYVAPGAYAEVETNNWNNTSLSWDKTSRRSYTYTAGILTGYVDQEWYSAATGWENVSNGIFTYSGGNLTQKLSQAWRKVSMSWENQYSMDYRYDSDGNLVYELMSKADGSGALERSNEHYYYYAGSTGMPGGNTVRNMQLYPNPAVNAWAYLDYVTTNAVATEAVLSDISGKALMHIQEAGSIGDHSVKIPVADLAKGVYILQLISGGRPLQTMKLVK